MRTSDAGLITGAIVQIGKALTAAGEAFSVGDLPVTETPVATTKAFKVKQTLFSNRCSLHSH